VLPAGVETKIPSEINFLREAVEHIKNEKKEIILMTDYQFFSFLTEKNLDSSIQEGVDIDIKYEGYLKRQKNNIEQINRQSFKSLPQEINYEKIDTLSLEARENLNKIKPKNFGDASKIPGVSKAD